MSELPRPSPENESRDHGAEFLIRVAAMFRIGRTYSTENQLFAQQIDMLLESARPFLQRNGQMLLVVHGGEIFLDGIRVATTSQGFRMAKTLVAEFRQRGIAGFEVTGEPSTEEWRRLFELLLDPRIAPGEAIVRAARDRGIEQIQLALHVLEDPSDGDDCDYGLGHSAHAVSADDETRSQAKTDTVQLGAVGGRVASATAARLGAAPKLYAASLKGLQSILTSTTAQNGLELRHARRVVQPIVEAATSPDPIVLGLAGMIKRDEFTYARNVNACMIATAIGHRFGFERGILANLSVAALLHGIGRSVTSDPEAVGPAGVVLLARRATMGETTVKVMRVALEAGSGHSTPGRSSVYSQIVAIASTYARFISARGPVGQAATPSQVLGMIVGPLTGGFDPALKLALVETLGFYPPGQLVELDDGTLTMVIGANRESLDRPVVHALTGPERGPLTEPVAWPGGVVPDGRRIVRPLRPEDMPEEWREAA